MFVPRMSRHWGRVYRPEAWCWDRGVQAAGSETLPALALELGLWLGCSTVQKQLFSFVTKLLSLKNGCSASHELPLKRQPLAQQYAQCGPCPTSLLSMRLVCEYSPQVLVWCDTAATLRLAHTLRAVWVGSLPAQGSLCSGLNMSEDEYCKLQICISRHFLCLSSNCTAAWIFLLIVLQ